MSHKITKHHSPRQERVHQEGHETHREKKDQQRLMYTCSANRERQGTFDRNRDALRSSKIQNKLTGKVKAEEAAIALPGKVDRLKKH